MTFSDQFKEIFNLVFEKIGVAIDWTQDNIIPYVMELCKRYALLNVVEQIISIIFGIVTIVVLVRVLKIIIKDYEKAKKEKKDTFWWERFSYGDIEPKVGTVFFFVGGGMAAITAIVFACVGVSELLRWCFIPEIQLIKEFSYLISTL